MLETLRSNTQTIEKKQKIIQGLIEKAASKGLGPAPQPPSSEGKFEAYEMLSGEKAQEGANQYDAVQKAIEDIDKKEGEAGWHDTWQWVLLAASALALVVLKAHPVLVVLGAGLIGILIYR